MAVLATLVVCFLGTVGDIGGVFYITVLDPTLSVMWADTAAYHSRQRRDLVQASLLGLHNYDENSSVGFFVGYRSGVVQSRARCAILSVTFFFKP